MEDLINKLNTIFGSPYPVLPYTLYFSSQNIYNLILTDLAPKMIGEFSGHNWLLTLFKMLKKKEFINTYLWKSFPHPLPIFTNKYLPLLFLSNEPQGKNLLNYLGMLSFYHRKREFKRRLSKQDVLTKSSMTALQMLGMIITLGQFFKILDSTESNFRFLCLVVYSLKGILKPLES